MVVMIIFVIRLIALSNQYSVRLTTTIATLKTLRRIKNMEVLTTTLKCICDDSLTDVL